MIFGIMGWTGLWGIIHEGREGGCLNCDFWDYGMDMIVGDCPRRILRGAKWDVGGRGDGGTPHTRQSQRTAPTGVVKMGAFSRLALCHVGAACDTGGAT